MRPPVGWHRTHVTSDPGRSGNLIGLISHSAELRPGGSTELDLGDLAPGTYELSCDVADHVEQGMVATLVVTD